MHHRSDEATNRRGRGRLVAASTFAAALLVIAAYAAVSLAAGGGVATARARALAAEAAPTTIPVQTPLKAKPPTGKLLVILGTSQPQNVQIQQELESLAGKAGWKTKELSYDPANTATLQSSFTTALSLHPNYIEEAGNTPTPTELSAMKSAGVKFAGIGIYPASPGTAPMIADADSFANDKPMGRIIADEFISLSNGKGNGVVVHVPAYPILDSFTDGFYAEVKALCPGCKTTEVDVPITDIANGTLDNDVIAALQRDPSAKYVIFDDGPWADGFPQALQKAGLSGLKIMGEASDADGIAGLKNGTETAWTGFQASFDSYEVMDAMFRDSEHMKIPYTAEDTQPTQLIIKANAGSPNWGLPANALSQYEKLWHLG